MKEGFIRGEQLLFTTKTATSEGAPQALCALPLCLQVRCALASSGRAFVFQAFGSVRA